MIGVFGFCCNSSRNFAKSDVDEPVASENSVQIDSRSAAESEHHRRMIALGLLFLRLLCDRFKPRQQLEAEILVLRHQLNILQQRAPGRPHFRWVDRALFIWLYRRCPRILNAITVVRPETVLRWHRMGFATYWGCLVHREADRGSPKRCAT